MPDSSHTLLPKRIVAFRQGNWRWITGIGVLCVFLTGFLGFTVEKLFFGWSKSSAFALVEEEVQAQFRELTTSLRLAARTVASRHELIYQTIENPELKHDLFEVVITTRNETPPGDLAITIYDAHGSALAWSGRSSEISPKEILEKTSLFVKHEPQGLRLVHLEPVVVSSATNQTDQTNRIATVAVEYVLTKTKEPSNFVPGTHIFPATIANVSLQIPLGEDELPSRQTGLTIFSIHSDKNELLLTALVSEAEIKETRNKLHRLLISIALGFIAVTSLLLIGSSLKGQARAQRASSFIAALSITVGLLIFSRFILLLAIPPGWSTSITTLQRPYEEGSWEILRSPLDFLLNSLLIFAFVALAGHAVYKLRLASRHWRWIPSTHPIAFTLVHFSAGTLLFAIAHGQEIFLKETIDYIAVDILQFSLYPWDGARLALAAGLIIIHAAVAWGGITLLLLATYLWRFPKPITLFGATMIGLWLIPTAAWLGTNSTINPEQQNLHALLVTALCIGATLLSRRVIPWYRHSSQAARLPVKFAAIFLPAIALYPSIIFHTDHARRYLVEQEYTTQAVNHPKELQIKLSRSLQQIDDFFGLDKSIISNIDIRELKTDRAFFIWQQTELAKNRLTSAVELYGRNGNLLSRFALNLPERTTTFIRQQDRSCRWEVSGEASRLGTIERRLLHAERNICGDSGTYIGAIVVHVMLDHGVLPFLPPRSPYLEFMNVDGIGNSNGLLADKIELVIYGWGQLPIYSSGSDAWLLSEAIFSKIYTSRTPFWETLSRGGNDYNVYLFNNREGIYALGYLKRRSFDVLLNLAELAGLSGIVYLALSIGSVFFFRITRLNFHSGHYLLQEIKHSFYRKLFLAFIAASVIPVIILSIVIRTYFTTLLSSDIESEASRTVALVRRVVEEETLSASTVNDDTMVWIGQIIDQDVNIFDGAQLVATSERDLFASGHLPTRTPEGAYRAIVLQRLPSFIGRDSIGDRVYMLAATPIRLGGRDLIMTVPLGLRQREIDQEAYEFDRGVYLAGVLFVLLGAGIGFSMAERIGDPVKRLTRATRQIARGDLDVRLTVKSADELQRLVGAFNSMANELNQQRKQLERTNRLEAWAEMARQVAHEIKNPLTPIQLSAEHLQRFHKDRGSSLSPVLENCVDSILKQVKLLRQISSEFSSFASSPVAKPTRLIIGELIEEVVKPYRIGLKNRIQLKTSIPIETIFVMADSNLLGRAITNVIENALQAMPNQGSLLIRVKTKKDSVHIITNDTGIGMDGNELTRVFEPYFSTKTSGTGLGLTIARRNIELNKGTVSVTSEKGRGTTVTFYLPIEK